MTDDHDLDDRAFANDFQREYQRTPLPGATARERLLAAARAEPRPARGWSWLAAWLEPRSFTLRPIVAVTAAVALLGAGALLARRAAPPAPDRASTTVASSAAGAPQAVQFVLVAPDAQRVALVGDFNGWDAAATPLAPGARQGAWSVTVQLPAGWHAYAFVIDGTRWVHDPGAPRAPADEFGGPRSVVVVGDGET
jgi:hypothetical protein